MILPVSDIDNVNLVIFGLECGINYRVTLFRSDEFNVTCAAFLSFMPAWQTFIWVTKGLLVSLTFIVLLRGVATNEVNKVPHF